MKNIIDILKNQTVYRKLQHNAWEWSKEINFEKSYKDFANIITG